MVGLIKIAAKPGLVSILQPAMFAVMHTSRECLGPSGTITWQLDELRHTLQETRCNRFAYRESYGWPTDFGVNSPAQSPLAARNSFARA